MATISATEKVNKFFNKFEKSAGCEDFLAGTLGLCPIPFDELKVSKDIVIYTDILTDRNIKKRFLSVFVVKKDGRFYDRVIDGKQVEIPSDMREYLEKAKMLTLEVASEIDNKGLVK